MTERPESPKDLSKLVEQSVSTLQEVDRRLQMVRSDLAALITRAGQVAPASGFGPFGPSVQPPQGLPLGAVPAFPAPPVGGAFLPSASPYGAPFGLGVPAAGFGGQAVQQNAKEMEREPPMPRVPSVDLIDAGDEFVVHIEMPGVKKDDLDILVSERTAVVSGQARPEVRTDGALLLRERGPVLYRRTIPLPAEVQTTQSKATFKDGILILNIPKKVAGEGPRRLDVAYG